MGFPGTDTTAATISAMRLFAARMAASRCRRDKSGASP